MLYYPKNLTTEQANRIVFKFDAYCKTVIRNAAREMLRAKAKRDRAEYLCPCPSDGDAVTGLYLPEELLIAATDTSVFVQFPAVYESLIQLPEKQRDALVMKYFMKLSDKDIADKFGVGTRTIRKWRKQSKMNLKGIIGQAHLGKELD